jgi:hypothetical protein
VSQVRTQPGDYPYLAPPAITVHALKENKRPIGYAPWPEPAKPKRVRKPRARKAPPE